MTILSFRNCNDISLCLPTTGVLKAVIDHPNLTDNIWWHTASHAPLTLTQNPEAVRAGNYRDCFVNQAHPWLLLVNSHTHPWNSWKRTLLVWLCWSAYCNYVAFNCALLTPSDWDELWPGTEMSLLFVESRLVGFGRCSSCFVIKVHFSPFHSAVVTGEKQWRRERKKAKHFGPGGDFLVLLCG